MVKNSSPEKEFNPEEFIEKIRKVQIESGKKLEGRYGLSSRRKNEILAVSFEVFKDMRDEAVPPGCIVSLMEGFEEICRRQKMPVAEMAMMERKRFQIAKQLATEFKLNAAVVGGLSKKLVVFTLYNGDLLHKLKTSEFSSYPDSEKLLKRVIDEPIKPKEFLQKALDKKISFLERRVANCALLAAVI
jgi:hypothetical protein